MAIPNTSSKTGFTLIEMLVVIVIISLLATAIAIGVNSAQDQARDTHCLAHLKNLHNAATSYLADKGHFPGATSFEAVDENPDEDGDSPNGYQLNYGERVGWVAWIRPGIEKTSKNSPYKGEGKHQSHAAEFSFVGCGATDEAKDVQQSIREGALFKYAGKDYSTYFCKKAFEGKYAKARRTYAMNEWFYSNRIRNYNTILRNTASLSQVESSRLVMFVELEKSDGTKGAKGDPADMTKDADDYKALKSHADDSAWEYGDSGAKESLGCWHKRAGKECTHAVFADGHVEIILKEDDGDGDNYVENESFLSRIRKGTR